jgi:hypothetical protein
MLAGLRSAIDFLRVRPRAHEEDQQDRRPERE